MILPPECNSALSEKLIDAMVEYEVDDHCGSSSLASELLDNTREFFASGAANFRSLFGERDYEDRPQQSAMALAVAKALTEGNNLCVEAPTGVGKSFAYLVPLFFRASQCALPALVSTGTITLQEQLLHKDIPLLKKLTGLDVKCALAKGRRNYLCLRRFEMLCGEEKDALLPVPSMIVDIDHLQRRMDNGFSGEADDPDLRIDPQLWNMVCCETGNCMGPKCVFFRKCYYYRARKQWDEADIVVANHALFFTDLAMRSEGDTTGLLPNYGVVLIDEAHTLEDHAADHLGLHLAEYALIGTLNRLFNPDNAKGILMRGGSSYLELRKMIADLRAEAYRFFGTYSDYLDEQRESALTITNPARFPERLSPKLFDAVQLMDEISEDEADESFKTEFCSLMNRLRDFGDMIVEFTCQNRPDTVYYAERDRNQLILNGSPLRVDQLLNRHLFRQDFPVILCSATLTVRNTFDYYFGRIGFCNGTNLKLDSPFSPDQAKIYIPRYFPEPSDPAFPQALVESLPQYIELTDGKAFVLFTSYQTMRYCADKLRHTFEARGWKLLVQGIDGQRSQILSDFRNDVNSVLFGTDSFWTGVDVPGEALSNVIVTKLPFAVPSHPLIAARMREIERDGKSSFSEYSLPEAVLKFRQGAGRLIRSRQDTGVIVVLDHRVVSKGYGRLFLDALPYQVVLE